MTILAPNVPRATVFLRLLAGRGIFRLGTQAMSIVLVMAWTTDDFGWYSNAVGMCSCLVLVSAAPEKAALRAIPRCRRLSPGIAGTSLSFAIAPPSVLLVALVVTSALAPSANGTTYVAAAALALCSGLLNTLSGLHRLRGRPDLDVAIFVAAGCAVATATTLTWLIGWGPQLHLTVVTAGFAVVIAVALGRLPRDWARRNRGRPLARRMARLTWMLGIPELCDALGFTVVYATMAVSGMVVESGALYIALLLVAGACQPVVYALRVLQPRMSMRQRGSGGEAAREQAAVLLRRSRTAGLSVAGLFALATVVAPARGWMLGAGYVATLTLLGVAAVVLFVTVTWATVLLENTNDEMLRFTSSAAAGGVLAVVVFALVLVPLLGAIGGMAALSFAIPVKALVLRRLITHARSASLSAGLAANTMTNEGRDASQ